jgi:hypothetical protein
MNPTAQAVLAVAAAGGGDASTAQQLLAEARQGARSTGRRNRQVVQIASLVVAGHGTRAAGLALEHLAEFPADTELMASIAPTS